MEFKPIYKRTANGGIQMWNVEVYRNKYRTISGRKDGKQTTTKWTVCSAKNVGKANETSPEVQAFVEATNLRRIKLGGEYFETLKDLEAGLAFVKPMRAYDYVPEEVTYPCVMQPKLDGMRCIATKNGLFTRTGKPIVSVPHIWESLSSIFDKEPDRVIDGELYAHELKDELNEILSLCRKQLPNEEELAASKESIKYWVYDGYVDSEKTTLERILDTQKTVDKREYIIKTPTFVVFNQKALDDYYDQFIEEGYEGAMIRNYNAGYEFKRSKNLLKRKDFITEEFEILDFIEGKGTRSGTVGAVTCKLTDNTTFKPNIKGTHKYLKELWDNREAYVGTQATVQYTKRSAYGVPLYCYVIDINRPDGQVDN